MEELNRKSVEEFDQDWGRFLGLKTILYYTSILISELLTWCNLGIYI